MRIEYRTTAAGLRWEQLDGFFVGWAVRPSAQTLLDHLVRSYRCAVAVDARRRPRRRLRHGRVRRVLAAYIPLVEVLPGWHERGIGTELMNVLLEQLRHLYMVDLACEEDARPFYEKLGMEPARAMIRRNHRALRPYAEET